MFDWPTTSRMALSATSFTVISGFWMLKRILLGVLDAPEHDEIDVDDVLVAGQHQALLGHVAHAARGAAVLGRAERMPISMMFCASPWAARTSSIG